MSHARRKSAKDVRTEIYHMVSRAADERRLDGDEEGSMFIKDLALDIARLPLVEEPKL